MKNQKRAMIRDMDIIATRPELQRLVFAVMAMIGRNDLLYLLIEDEKYEKFLAMLAQLRMSLIEANNE